MQEATTQTARYPIRTVSNLTGVNAITLRAWERRYGLVKPQRTPKGHRLYTELDIQRINRVVSLLNQGMSIGQVKPLLDAGIAPAERPGGGQQDPWADYRTTMLDAIRRFDEPALDEAYNDALSLYPVELVIRHLAVPLLTQLGKQWKDGPTGIAEEHFFSSYLRNKIATRLQHLNARSTGPLLLVSCLPGEFHELGMLFFALTAVSYGYRVLLLGANLPLEQIPAVLAQRHCNAVVLSGSGRPQRGVLEAPLSTLVNSVGVPVFVGGALADKHAEAIAATGATAVGHDIAAALQTIGTTLNRRNPAPS